MLVKITGKKNEEVLTTTSRDVAEVFGKRHDQVVRDIEKIISQLGSPQNWGSFFIKSEYIDSQNNRSKTKGINS